MIIITVVDNRNGMLFNHRRQSQDGILREKILEMAKEKKIWMNAFSAKQFSQEDAIMVDEEFLEKAQKGEYCFVEDQPVASALDRIESVILFHWNRDYPGDFYFDLDLSDGSWELESTEDFAGSSHEDITKEVYLRV